MDNICFVCGIDRNTFDRKHPIGYDWHQLKEHSIWHTILVWQPSLCGRYAPYFASQSSSHSNMATIPWQERMLLMLPSEMIVSSVAPVGE